MRLTYHIHRYLATALLLIGSFTSCNNGESRAETIASPIVIERFDLALPTYVIESDSIAIADFQAQYAPFFPIYCQRILGLGDAPNYQEGLKLFTTNEAVAKLYADTQAKFSTDSIWQHQLQNTFARFAEQFPGQSVPRLLTHVSGLNQSVVTVDTLLSISLDCYLGKDYSLYAQRYYEYELPLHESNRMTMDATEVWLRTCYPYQSERNALLDRMVYEGKILLALSHLFPDNDVFQLLGYTAEQTQWCQANEGEAWKQIISRKHLFNTETMLIHKYIEPAPFVSALHNEAPGRLGRWVGYQIVSQYARLAKQSAQQLLATPDNAGEILAQSKYSK